MFSNHRHPSVHAWLTIFFCLFLLLPTLGFARSWKTAGKLVYPEGEAYILNDGRVFAPAVDYLHPGSQIWDPATKLWSASAPMLSNRYGFATVVLDDQRVLVTGGVTGSELLNTAEIYDPATNQWTASAGTMNVARYQHRTIKLKDGRILIAGGCSAWGCAAGARLAEIYDPRTDSFAPTGSLVANSVALTANLLKNGKVLITGETTTAELYNPNSGAWSRAGNMSTNRIFHNATTLANGKVLVTGGSDNWGALLNTAEVFDPATRSWSTVGPMSAVREQHAAVRLPGGKVLIAGGMSVLGDAYVVLKSTELFDPETGTFIPGVSMLKERVDFGMLLLPDGRAMAVGGDYYVIGDGKFYPGDAETF